MIQFKSDCLPLKPENHNGSEFYDNYLIRNFFGYGLEEQLSPQIKNFISEMLTTKCKRLSLE